jgi:hypothetical protein
MSFDMNIDMGSDMSLIRLEPSTVDIIVSATTGDPRRLRRGPSGDPCAVPCGSYH